MHVNGTVLTRACVAATVAAVLVLAAGCGKKDKMAPAGGEPDKFLFERGTDSLNRHRWIKAREYFRQLVDNYPQSVYRPDAKLGLGDTYLGEGTTESLILSANEFREFLTYFPTHRRADYAQYKLACAHYEQMLAPLRDQTQTRDAIKEFETFVERYPTSKLLPDGQKKLRECKDRLSNADYQVGYFYYRSRWYPGAISRLRAVLKNDPGYTNRDAVYYYLAECYMKVQLQAEALPMLDQLTKEFPKSEYLERAKKLMAEIQATAADPRTPKKDVKAKK